VGEIKSALELAIEKSEKYVISDEERERIRGEEILQKVTGLFHVIKRATFRKRDDERDRENGREGAERVKEVLFSR